MGDDHDAGLSNEEAAEILGIAPQTLAVWRMQGRGPEFHKVGKRVEYSQRAVREFEEKLRAVRGPARVKLD
jgi:hypothetical protein